MNTHYSKPHRTRKVAEAKESDAPAPGRKPLGQWLVDNMPRGTDLEIPSRREPGREIPFVD
jgi:hypothetical protein